MADRSHASVARPLVRGRNHARALHARGRGAVVTTLAVLALAAATLVAREVARAYGRSVRARFAAERADEQETQRWLAIVRGPRRDGEVYA